jgi:dipeptidase E
MVKANILAGTASRSGKPAVRKIVACGRGRVIQASPIKQEIINLTGKTQPRVAYLGTATFDSDDAYNAQAKGFADSGCFVERVNLTNFKEAKKSMPGIKKSLESADIIAVSGGNTLFAMTRFRKLGVDKLLKKALDRGAVCCGGSAGAICWFDGGHSDSRDPTTVQHVKPK